MIQENRTDYHGDVSSCQSMAARLRQASFYREQETQQLTKRRVIVLFDNFGAYHVARLGAAAKKLDLLAVEVAAQSEDYAWEPIPTVPFQRVTIFANSSVALKKERGQFLLKFQDIVSRFEPEAIVIPGWSDRFAAMALGCARAAGVRVVLMSDSQRKDSNRNPIGESIKRCYVSLCDAALVGGAPHRRYIEDLGMAADRIEVGYDAVDNGYFKRGADRARMQGDMLRRALGLPRRYFLASARFVEKKNLAALIQAYGHYAEQAARGASLSTERWHLVLLGDGEGRQKLERLISELGLNGFVHMPGFKQYADLPAFYGLAEAFVHASKVEQWGLVVNEAMASGLPVIVSGRCGCAPDLVENRRNGFTFDPHDVEALSQCLSEVASENCDRLAMSAASREIISRWTPDTFARGLEKAVETATRYFPNQIGSFDRALLWALSLR